MTFWLLAGAMILVTLAVLVAALVRPSRPVPPRGQHDLAVYRDQLRELERDQARGLLEPGEVESARREVERRLLAADSAGPAAGAAANGGRPGRALVVVLCLAVPAAAAGLYLSLGAPGIESQPFAERPAGDPPGELHQVVEQLAQRLAQASEDPEGWRLLGRSYAQLGRFTDAAAAFEQAIVQGDDSANAHADLGEMLAAANDGVLVAPARHAFAAALERDPANPRARYYAGLAYAQDGLLAEALELWRSLAHDSPATAPWRQLLEQQIAALEAELGEPPSGPSQADLAAAAELSAEERAAMIESMVARLAERLETTPDDLAGWLKLSQAYSVLGRRSDAATALQRAADLAADLPADAPEHAAIDQARARLNQLE